MATKTKRDFRLKIIDPMMGNVSYAYRHNGNVFYQSASEMPLALSNLVGAHATEARFALLDAVNGDDAAKSLRAFIRKEFPRADPARLSEVIVIVIVTGHFN